MLAAQCPPAGRLGTFNRDFIANFCGERLWRSNRWLPAVTRMVSRCRVVAVTGMCEEDMMGVSSMIERAVRDQGGVTLTFVMRAHCPLKDARPYRSPELLRRSEAVDIGDVGEERLLYVNGWLQIVECSVAESRWPDALFSYTETFSTAWRQRPRRSRRRPARDASESPPSRRLQAPLLPKRAASASGAREKAAEAEDDQKVE